MRMYKRGFAGKAEKIVLSVTLFVCFDLLATSVAAAEKEPISLFMPDGQLKSHAVQVFVDRDITPQMQPRLKLVARHPITDKHSGEDAWLEPLFLASGQRWEQEVGGTRITFTGTLMLFDLSEYPMPFYKAMMRLTPVLAWKDPGAEGEVGAMGARPVYLGNLVSAMMWTLLLVALLVGAIASMARRAGGGALNLLCEPGGRLSLARTQVALWTVVIGGVVTGFGLIRLEVPTIPASVLALMGLSLATGGISYFRGVEETGFEPAARAGEVREARWADLICIHTPDEASAKPSIARAQMLFWTVLVVALFVTKSIVDGELWDVPWELVGLMGMSQIGYLSPKLLPQADSGPEQPGSKA